MRSFLIRASVVGVLIVGGLFVSFGTFITSHIPTAAAAVPTQNMLRGGPGGPMGMIAQGFAAKVSVVEHTLATFAVSFTSQKVTTNELCVQDAGGQTCITRSELNTLLSASNIASALPSVSISIPTNSNSQDISASSSEGTTTITFPDATTFAKTVSSADDSTPPSQEDSSATQ